MKEHAKRLVKILIGILVFLSLRLSFCGPSHYYADWASARGYGTYHMSYYRDYKNGIYHYDKCIEEMGLLWFLTHCL